MPRVPTVPSFRLHKPSGQAVVTIRQSDGVRRDVYLGEYNTPRSRQEYARIVAELAVNPGSPAPPSERGPDTNLTMNQLLVAYLHHAGNHYRGPDGTSTGETERIKVALRHVRELYGHTPAREFGPRNRSPALNWRS